MSPSAQKQAVVVCTECDDDIRMLCRAAREIEGLLRAAGYDAHALHGEGDATRARLGKVLGPGEGPRPFALGFFCAHGSREGAHEKSPGSCLLLDAELCLRFQEATLVLCCCLAGGEFPALITQHPDSVRTVIGYRPLLGVGADIEPMRSLLEALRKGQEADTTSAQYLSMFTAALVEPIRSLLGGLSLGEALDRAKQKWEEVSRLVHDRGHFKLALLWGSNVSSLSAWPQPAPNGPPDAPVPPP
jgi:hypothetical protein